MRALRRYAVLASWQGTQGAGERLPEPPHRQGPDKPSSEREYGPVDTIVIHATAGSSSVGALSVMSEGRASWHVLVPDEDEEDHGRRVLRCVGDGRKAWHVLRKCTHPADGRNDINSRSFGVEIVNRQDGRDPFSDWQLQITAEYVDYWRSRYPIRYLATHAYLDPARKLDPGEGFDWERFLGYVEAGERKKKEAGEAERGGYPPAGTRVKVVLLPGSRVIDCRAEFDGERVRADLRALAEALGAEVYDRLEEQGKVYVRPGGEKGR